MEPPGDNNNADLCGLAWTPLLLAAKVGDAVTVRRLLELGESAEGESADASRTMCTPMSVAAAFGHAHIVQLLQAAGAGPDTVSLCPHGRHLDLDLEGSVVHTTPLISAAVEGHTALVELLISHGARHDLAIPLRGTALASAVLSQYNLAAKADVVHALLRGGADPNYQASDGTTALFLAAREGYADAAEALLLGGAHPGLRNARGVSPLDAAAREGKLEAIRTLLRRGADVNARSPLGDSVIRFAPQFDIAVVRALLDAGANPEVANHLGWTALLAASHCGVAEVVTELVSRGVRLDRAILSGKNALTLAAENERHAVVELLLAAGMVPNTATSPLGLYNMYRRERREREDTEALLAQERAKIGRFTYAIPHMVAAAAQSAGWGRGLGPPNATP